MIPVSSVRDIDPWRLVGSGVPPVTKRKNFVTNRELKISKIQNSNFVSITKKKIQQKFEKIQKLFEGGVAF